MKSYKENDRGYRATLMSGLVRKQKSHTREEKLKIVCYCYENGRNLYQACNKFLLNMKTVQR